MPGKCTVGWHLYHIVKAERSIFFFPCRVHDTVFIYFSAMLQEVFFWGMRLQFGFPKSQGLCSPRCRTCCQGWREKNDPASFPHLPLVSWQWLLETKHRSEMVQCAFSFRVANLFCKDIGPGFPMTETSRPTRSGATETNIRWGRGHLSYYPWYWLGLTFLPFSSLMGISPKFLYLELKFSAT